MLESQLYEQTQYIRTLNDKIWAMQQKKSTNFYSPHSMSDANLSLDDLFIQIGPNRDLLALAEDSLPPRNMNRTRGSRDPSSSGISSSLGSRYHRSAVLLDLLE